MDVLVEDLKSQNALKYFNTHQPVNMICFGSYILSCIISYVNSLLSHITYQGVANLPHNISRYYAAPTNRQIPISPAIRPTSFHPIQPYPSQLRAAPVHSSLQKVSHPWGPSSTTATTTTTTHPPTPTPPTPMRCTVIKDWHGPANALWIACPLQLTAPADGAWL